jgi:hypothetical protein|tara:strand:- start:10533 stop:11150 length:618 start_codon:yes stop_codon:yes gene_type:complete
MGAGYGFEDREKACAENFLAWIAEASCKRIIYLGGLVPEGEFSHHLSSRETVNRVLRSGLAAVTTLRALIVVGSGSASFKIIRDLLRQNAATRELSQLVIPVPFLTPGLSSHWLHFVTTTTMPLTKTLIGSLSNEAICRDDHNVEMIPQEILTCKQAIETAFTKIAQNRVPSSWIDSLSSATVGLLPKIMRGRYWIGLSASSGYR